MITADPYGISRKIVTYDTPQQIAMCLRCAKPDCTNCISAYAEKRHRGRRDKEFLLLYGEGLTDADIAQRMGISTRTVRHYREKYELQRNAPRQDPCVGCRSKDVCDRFGGTCRDKERYRDLRRTNR